MTKKAAVLSLGGVVAAIALLYAMNGNQDTESALLPDATSSPAPTATHARVPEVIPIEENPLKDAIIAAGNYLVRQQLANGELAYQVNILNHERGYSPSYVRLIAGAGSLYTVCRVSGEMKYCEAGDRALDHYLELLVNDPQRFEGTCLYTNGGCPLGGAALTVDAIYKRWQASGGFVLDERDLLAEAENLGYFIASMRKPGGGFYHSFDPHFAGTVDPDYFVIYFPGESLYALLEIHEMTGNDFWLQQAREVNDFMTAQPVTEDHWHGYAFSMLARLDKLVRADQEYARRIAETVIAGQVRSLDPANTSISTATKVEALSAIAQALYLSGAEHDWLDRDIRTFITFVLARQLPNDNCNFDIEEDILLRYAGGVYSSCDDPSIRVDGVQHWINGVATYLEYQSMIEGKRP